MNKREHQNWADLANVLTAQDVAEILHVSQGTAKRMLRAGEIPAVRIGAGWRINKLDLMKFLNISNGDDLIDGQL